MDVFYLESKVRGSDEGRQQVHQVEYQVVEHHEQISHKPKNNNKELHLFHLVKLIFCAQNRLKTEKVYLNNCYFSI